MLKKLSLTLIAGVAIAASAQAQQARDQIRAVGSSTVYPFTTTVAEQFGRANSGRFKTPIVESIGTGGGIRAFCMGVGLQHPDIANASRRMNKNEFDECQKNGARDIVEVKIGFDGIVLAVRKGALKMDLTREQIWRALAKEVPVNGRLVANPYRNWSDIDPKLPNSRIEVYGPPPTSGTRDAFNELVMQEGSRNIAEIRAITDSAARARAQNAMREDGAFIEAGENDNLIVQRLTGSATALGVFGYSFLDQNIDKLEGKKIEGQDPTFENIASGKYPIARSMFIYIKKAHVGVVPGLQEFANEYVSERSFGQTGYLANKGLIPLPQNEREAVRRAVSSMTPFRL